MKGIEDLKARTVSPESLLVSIARKALSDKGHPLAPALELDCDPEIALYLLLAETEHDNAHSAYNALLRSLTSFLRSA